MSETTATSAIAMKTDVTNAAFLRPWITFFCWTPLRKTVTNEETKPLTNTLRSATCLADVLDLDDLAVVDTDVEAVGSVVSGADESLTTFLYESDLHLVIGDCIHCLTDGHANELLVEHLQSVFVVHVMQR